MVLWLSFLSVAWSSTEHKCINLGMVRVFAQDQTGREQIANAFRNQSRRQGQFVSFVCLCQSQIYALCYVFEPYIENFKVLTFSIQPTRWPRWVSGSFGWVLSLCFKLMSEYESQTDSSTDESHSLDPVPRFLDSPTETSDSDSPDWLPNQNLFRWLSINDIEPILLKLRIKFYFSLFPFPVRKFWIRIFTSIFAINTLRCV